MKKEGENNDPCKLGNIQNINAEITLAAVVNGITKEN